MLTDFERKHSCPLLRGCGSNNCTNILAPWQMKAKTKTWGSLALRAGPSPAADLPRGGPRTRPRTKTPRTAGRAAADVRRPASKGSACRGKALGDSGYLQIAFCLLWDPFRFIQRSANCFLPVNHGPRLWEIQTSSICTLVFNQ